MRQIIWLHLLLVGTMLYQSFFMMVQWYIHRRREYLYYVAYILSCSFFLIFRLDKTLGFLPFHITGAWDEMIDRPLIIFALWMYIRFGQFFLQLKELQPKVYGYAVKLEWVFAGFVALTILLIPLKLPGLLASIIYLAAVLLLALLGGVVIFRLLRQKNLLNNYLVLGSLCITVGGVAGPIIALFLPQMGDGGLVVYTGLEIGILIELLLLNTGLVVKNKMMQQQVINTQQLLIAELQQTNLLRNNLGHLQQKISSNLHDDIGASLSSIQLYVEVIEKVVDKDPPRAKELLAQVRSNAGEIIANMGDIVWALNSAKPLNASFEDRLKNHCYEFLAPKDITCMVEIPDWFNTTVTNIHVLRNLMMVSKECLNNIAKYSQASHCEVQALLTDIQLLLRINDDGIGFDKDKTNGGNGLRNMQQRIVTIGGQLLVQSGLGQGTSIGIVIPIDRCNSTN
ncbi:MAG: 7TM diverse intracellular signaling domain-containing protein [Bacteroidota bacterium]